MRGHLGHLYNRPRPSYPPSHLQLDRAYVTAGVYDVAFPPPWGGNKIKLGEEGKEKGRQGKGKLREKGREREKESEREGRAGEGKKGVEGNQVSGNFKHPCVTVTLAAWSRIGMSSSGHSLSRNICSLPRFCN